MKILFCVLLLHVPLYIPAALAAETPEERAVVARVQEFFDAMTARDTEAMRELLTDDGILYGYREGPDGLQVIRPTHRQYIDGLGAGTSRMIERFWEPTVLLHGRMAVVWAPYDLFVDGAFSHCGIDSFSLLKTDSGWTITGIVFSMEAEGCEPSPLGPLTDGQ